MYRPNPESLDFWVFDLVSGRQTRLTQLGNKGTLRAFDITPDGKHIVFDRVRQNSDIVLIERPKKRRAGRWPATGDYRPKFSLDAEHRATRILHEGVRPRLNGRRYRSFLCYVGHECFPRRCR